MRGDSTAASDVDFLVDFGGPTTLRTYLELKDLLEGALGTNVDLITARAAEQYQLADVVRKAVRVA